MIHRIDEHLPFRWLVDRADGVLAAPATRDAEAHLATGCARCAARDRGVRRILAAIAAGAPELPPSAADRRAVALFERFRTSRRRPETALFGVVVFDQAADLALATRSDGADVRRLLWTLGDYEIDAGIVPRGVKSDLLGQVLRSDDRDTPPVTGEVRAVRGRRTVARAPIAGDGRFTFRALGAASYVLEGEIDGRAFVLPLLVLD